MRLPLRYFLLLALFLGAVALPLGYRYFKARKAARVAAEIERLTEELEGLWRESMPLQARQFFPNTDWAAADRRIAQLESRLQELTGTRPKKPDLQLQQASGTPSAGDIQRRLDFLKRIKKGRFGDRSAF